MPENIEKVHIGKESEEDNRETLPVIEIPKGEWQTLETIAKRVAGDFGMEVKLGPPYLEEINPLTGRKEKIPYVAFENVKERSITFNPLFIKEQPRESKRIAAHEGAHRAITRGEHEIGLSEEQIRKLPSPEYLGFHSFRNIGLEDPRVNNYDTGRFPGLKELNKEVYDEQLKEENAQFIAPEVDLIISKLGRYPRYAEAASELLRFWHQGRCSKKLKPEIKKFLERVSKYAQEYQQNIPDVKKPHITEKEVLAKARECFTLYHDYIWPEVKKLVEMDLHIEEQGQMLKEIRQKQRELEQKREEMKEAQEQGDRQRQEELQKEIEGLEKELDPFNQLPEDVKKELQQKIDEAVREAVKQLNQEIDKRQKEIQEAKQKQEQLDKEIKDLEGRAKKASDKEKEDLEKEIEQKKAEKLAEEMKQKQAEKELEDIQKETPYPRGDYPTGETPYPRGDYPTGETPYPRGDYPTGETPYPRGDYPTGETPYPVDKLSEETKREIEKLFKNLPRQKQKELRRKAEQELEDFEDAINKELEGKLDQDKPESHKERREREKAEREAAKKIEEAKRERERIEKKLEEMRREKMTEYDRAYEEVADIVNSLYIRLKRFFLPERHPKWRKGYPTGSRLDLQKAMQAEADPRYLEKIWERKTIPHKFDYRFSLLVDTSSSMAREKIEETFKGVVALAEVLEKFCIQYEIIAFNDSSRIFKQWREKLNKEKRDYLSQIKNFCGGGTETTEATQRAYQEFLKNLGKDNFLLTLTDGLPNDPESLKQLLEKIKKEGKIKLVGIGLGPNTEFVKDYYKAAFSLPKMKVTEEERRQGKKDFTDAFADLLEDMIRHPEKY